MKIAIVNGADTKGENGMIFIDEKFPTTGRVVIQVEGHLNQETLPILDEVCCRHRDARHVKKIELDLSRLTHIGREAKDYLREVREWATLAGVPEFLRLELFHD